MSSPLGRIFIEQMQIFTINAIWQCDQFHKKAIHAKYMESTVNKHRIIVDALKAHDFNAFSDAMQHHFNDEYKSEDSELTTSHS